MSDNESPSSSDDDDDFGPMPTSSSSSSNTTTTMNNIKKRPANNDNNSPPIKKKKIRKVEHEKQLIARLPQAEMYEKSYMHRDVVRFIFVSKPNEFIITVSNDGVVKFWKKFETSIEFVKEFRAHLKQPTGASLSYDGHRFCTTNDSEKTIKIFDVVNFDMVQVVNVKDFHPGVCCWVYLKSPPAILAVANSNNNNNSNSDNSNSSSSSSSGNDFSIRLFKGESSGGIAKMPFASVTSHMATVKCMAFNHLARVAISVDEKGMIEYWKPKDGTFPKKRVKFRFASGTDLISLFTAKAKPYSITMSPDGKKFVILASDQQVRIFSFVTGKLKRQYNDCLRVVQDKLTETWTNATFDDTSNFLLYPSSKGIKILNLTTNNVVKVLGAVEESEHFLNCALYQGAPYVDSQTRVKRATEKGEQVDRSEILPDPTLFCTAHNQPRFYLFSSREPKSDDRDVYNEKPLHVLQSEKTAKAKLSSLSQANSNNNINNNDKAPGVATIHTTMGDIVVQLYPQKTPKTAQNWLTHAANGYYNGVVFHRVIKGFMLQTGDPTGTGRGGQSIWGGNFQDEIVRNLRHDKPGILSMANSGANTNGSQFFITCAATPWLDGKHTVFGRVVSGMNVVSAIENCPTDRSDRPLTMIKIVNVS